MSSPAAIRPPFGASTPAPNNNANADASHHSSSTQQQQQRPTDAKAAVGELLSELETTRREYAKLSIQLTQLDAELQQSKDLAAQHSDTIGELEALIVAKDAEHRAATREAEDRYITKDAALAHRARQLELEVQRLTAENEHLSRIEADNRSLRENTLDLQAGIEKLQIVNEDLRQRTRDGVGGAAFEEMEREFQKKLAAAEKKFRAEAYRALSEEAKIALQGNDHLQTVLKRQNDSIELVLQRCKMLEQSHGLMQSQQDRSVVEMEQQLREVARLAKALEETRSKNAVLDEAMRQRRVERASLELLFVEYEATRKRLAKAEEKGRRSAREAERWKDRAVQLTQELSDEQRGAAERRLLQLQSMSDTVEANAVRDGYRTELRARIAAKQQQGSLAFQFANANSSNTQHQQQDLSVDNPYAFVPSESSALVPAAGAGASSSASAVRPMDILSIWSKNYDDGFGGGGGERDGLQSGFAHNVTAEEADRLLEAIRQRSNAANNTSTASSPPLLLGEGPTAVAEGTSLNGVSTPAPDAASSSQRGGAAPTSGRRAAAAAAVGGAKDSVASVLGGSGASRRQQQQQSAVLPSVGQSLALSGISPLNGSVSGKAGTPTTTLGARDAVVAEKNRGLSVLSQSYSLHAATGTTARLPPSFQNSHRTTLASSTAAAGGGGGGRSGSALGSRGTVHVVSSSTGAVRVVPPTEPLTRAGGEGYAHPNTPRIAASTRAELEAAERQQQGRLRGQFGGGGSGVDAGRPAKLVP